MLMGNFVEGNIITIRLKKALFELTMLFLHVYKHALIKKTKKVFTVF